MNGTLKLWLEGPFQSYGTEPRFEHLTTGLEPSKSALVGMCCAAEGRDLSKDVSDLAGLRMGVLVLREGKILRDYHIARNVPMANGKQRTIQTWRYYLMDAVFLVGLEGDMELLERLQKAFENPAGFISLGRKACVPSESIWLPDGLREGELVAALSSYPRRPSRRWQYESPRKRLVLDLGLSGTDGEARNDWPLSLDPRSRRFATRRVKTMWVDQVEETDVV